jgi:hypothetical protein
MISATLNRKPSDAEIADAVFDRQHTLADRKVCLDISNRSRLALDTRAAFAQLLRELRVRSLPEISAAVGYATSAGAQAAMSRHNKRILELKQGARASLRAAGFEIG